MSKLRDLIVQGWRICPPPPGIGQMMQMREYNGVDQRQHIWLEKGDAYQMIYLDAMERLPTVEIQREWLLKAQMVYAPAKAAEAMGPAAAGKIPAKVLADEAPPVPLETKPEPPPKRPRGRPRKHPKKEEKAK